MKRNVIKIVGFLAILSIILIRINDLLCFRYTDGITQMDHYYKLDEDTVDVLVLGSSHAFVNVNPTQFYDEYGIASYNLCASMQPTWNTYYTLREALKYQTPDLIVLDVYRLTETFTYSKESKMIKSTYGMRFSANKYQSIYESLENPTVGETLLYMMEFPSYHGRYAEIMRGDLQNEAVVGEGYKGAHPVTEIAPMERPDNSHVTEQREIEPKTMLYFEKILMLANEHDIPVLLINAPYIMGEEDKKVFNSLEAYLATQEVHDQVMYVDYNRQYDELGLDFTTDFADYDHLNVNGSRKFNMALGAYIKANYDLEDRRGNPAFESYEIGVEDNL